jgi:hypothetical protein
MILALVGQEKNIKNVAARIDKTANGLSLPIKH